MHCNILYNRCASLDGAFTKIIRRRRRARFGLALERALCVLQKVVGIEVNYTTELSLKDFYSPSGKMSRLPSYEFRPQQLEAALAVQGFLRDADAAVLALEAPTGVGKTFAVLVPALMEARRRGAGILFLTASIALQEQVIGKDLPRLAELLDSDLRFGLLKGRSNYACLRRAGSLSGPSLFDAGPDPKGIKRWLQETEAGDLAELGLSPSSPLTADLSAGARQCVGPACPYRDRCFVVRAYRRAQDWDVAVANYNLFFSHILEGGGAFPLRYDWLLCDEAHRIPDAVRSSSAVRVGAESGPGLFGPRVLQGFAPLLRAQSVPVEELQAHASRAREELRTLFTALPLLLPRGGELSAPNEELLHRGQAAAEEADLLLRPLRAFEERFMAGSFSDKGEMARGAELMRWIDDVREFKRDLIWCLSAARFPSWAYWAESGALTSKPVAASEIVQEVLQKEAPEKLILTSATLTQGGSFDFWSRETGIVPDRSLVVDSPFDFSRQMEVLVLDVGLHVGEPGYDERMCRIMERLCDKNGGRTLVLLSSLRLLNAFADRMRAGDRGYSVLVQGDMPQRQLLKRFTEDETSTLIGSISFREGVDVPGEGLTQVIIDRIPFPHPNDPMVRARNELEGGKGFVRVTLPTARTLLRQAAGRLIRSSSDHGRVVLLDVRAVERKDWRILSAFPPCRLRKLSVEGV